MNRSSALILGTLTVTGLTVSAYVATRGDEAPVVSTAVVDRGDIVEAVSTSGTLEAVTTVQVGTQVSGSVQALFVDFNAIVKRGQTLARLDPSLLEAEVDQQTANFVRVDADRDRQRVAVADAGTKLDRARLLADRQLISQTELETAEVALRSAEAQLKSSDAQVTQAQASLNQARVNVEKTVIVSPIDGIVIARNVDVGQTVAASLQAPTLFVIAADLTRMRVNASLDESDIGRVRAGQRVRFTVDAYPADEFTGTVAQVRLNPTVAQNVVTYAALIDVGNPGLKLKPGMTATASIELSRRDGVLRVPAAAVRFKPTAEQLKALNPRTGEAVGAAAGRPSGDRLWQYRDGRLTATPIRIGASDGQFVELLETAVGEGTRVVTRVTTAEAQSSRPSPSASNPLLPPQGGRR